MNAPTAEEKIATLEGVERALHRRILQLLKSVGGHGDICLRCHQAIFTVQPMYGPRVTYTEEGLVHACR